MLKSVRMHGVLGGEKMNYTIRKCVLEDCAEIVKLNKEALGYDYPEELSKNQLKDRLKSEHDKIYVAVIENQVVGYVHANDYELLYAPPMKNIMGIAVCEQQRGKGMGKALLIQAEQWARETGALGVRLVSGMERQGAHEFYRKCGYLEKKAQKNFKKSFK